MTPKEKAIELVDKMERPLNDDYYLDFNNYAKECALIAVDEIIEVEKNIFKGIVHKSYWYEVKQEIEKL